jgi:hypothetical protein
MTLAARLISASTISESTAVLVFFSNRDNALIRRCALHRQFGRRIRGCSTRLLHGGGTWRRNTWASVDGPVPPTSRRAGPAHPEQPPRPSLQASVDAWKNLQQAVLLRRGRDSEAPPLQSKYSLSFQSPEASGLGPCDLDEYTHHSG